MIPGAIAASAPGRVVVLGLAAALAAAIPIVRPIRTAGAPAECRIVEGAEIAGIRIGMSARAALTVAGSPLKQMSEGTQVTYDLRPPWFRMVTEHDIVRKVSTRAPLCRTAGGVGPGTLLSAARRVYASARISSVTSGPRGDLVTYPLLGIALLVGGDRIDMVEVFRGESTGAARPPASPPAPAAPPGSTPQATPGPAATVRSSGDWSIRSPSLRVEGTALIVTGTVENRGRPMSVYAEVRAFDPAGRPMASGDGPVHPVPVPGGATGTFEARLEISDAVKRYMITLRPVGAITGALAELAVDVKNLQQFAAVVLRRVQVEVRYEASPGRFVVVVTNSSAVALARAVVTIEADGFCSVPNPTSPGRRLSYRWTGTAVVDQIPAGGTNQQPWSPQQTDCPEPVVVSVRGRVADVRISE